MTEGYGQRCGSQQQRVFFTRIHGTSYPEKGLFIRHTQDRLVWVRARQWGFCIDVFVVLLSTVFDMIIVTLLAFRGIEMNLYIYLYIYIDR
jgi:hypothetical protein